MAENPNNETMGPTKEPMSDLSQPMESLNVQEQLIGTSIEIIDSFFTDTSTEAITIQQAETDLQNGTQRLQTANEAANRLTQKARRIQEVEPSEELHDLATTASLIVGITEAQIQAQVANFHDKDTDPFLALIKHELNEWQRIKKTELVQALKDAVSITDPDLKKTQLEAIKQNFITATITRIRTVVDTRMDQANKYVSTTDHNEERFSSSYFRVQGIIEDITGQNSHLGYTLREAAEPIETAHSFLASTHDLRRVLPLKYKGVIALTDGLSSSLDSIFDKLAS